MHETVQWTEIVWGLAVLAGFTAQVCLAAGIIDAKHDAPRTDPVIKRVFEIYTWQVILHTAAKTCGLLWVVTSMQLPPTSVTDPESWEGWVTFLALTGMILFPTLAGWKLWYDRYTLRTKS